MKHWELAYCDRQTAIAFFSYVLMHCLLFLLFDTWLPLTCLRASRADASVIVRVFICV